MSPKKHQPRPVSQLERIYRRDRMICWICTKVVKRPNASRDHIVPKSKGGSDLDDNLRLACKTCNTRRGNKDESETFSHVDWFLHPASGQTNRYANRPKGLRRK